MSCVSLGLSQFPPPECQSKTSAVDENDISICDNSNSSQRKRRKLFDSSQPPVVTQDIGPTGAKTDAKIDTEVDADELSENDDFAMSRSPSNTRKRLRRISSSDDDDDDVVQSTQELKERLRLLKVILASN